VERSNQAVDVSDGVSAASPGAAVAAKSGTLSVSTDPSPLVFTIFDHSMTAVAQGVSPEQVQLPPGLYMVRVPRAGHPDLIQLAWVVSNATRSVRLSDSAPNIFSSWTSAFFRQVDEKLRKLPPLPTPGAALSLERPEATREQFWIRFRKLTGWSVSEPVEPVRFSTRYVQDKTIIEVTNPVRRVIFAQVARPSLPTVNVAIPLGGTSRPGRCDLVVSVGEDLLQAHVRLATEWANSALQYMTQGYLEEAKQLINSLKANEPSGLGGLVNKLFSRFEDPAASLVPRYLGLRTGEDTFINTIGQQFLDSFQQELSDALVIGAELAARERQYKLAAQKILNIRPGAVPLFTEGFSLLIHRLRELIDLDDEEPPPPTQRLEEGQIEKLKELMRAVSRWAPFLNLNSPTVTFRGDDLAAPDGKENRATPAVTEGWTSIPGPPAA